MKFTIAHLVNYSAFTAYRGCNLPVLSTAPNFLVSGFNHQNTDLMRALTGAGAGGQLCHMPFSYSMSMLAKHQSMPLRPSSFCLRFQRPYIL
jgi:hypothetical protein